MSSQRSVEPFRCLTSRRRSVIACRRLALPFSRPRLLGRSCGREFPELEPAWRSGRNAREAGHGSSGAGPWGRPCSLATHFIQCPCSAVARSVQHAVAVFTALHGEPRAEHCGLRLPAAGPHTRRPLHTARVREHFLPTARATRSISSPHVARRSVSWRPRRRCIALPRNPCRCCGRGCR